MVMNLGHRMSEDDLDQLHDPFLLVLSLALEDKAT